MQETDRATLVAIFSKAIEICDGIAAFASESDADSATVSGMGLQIGRQAGELFRMLDKAGAIPDIPPDGNVRWTVLEGAQGDGSPQRR